MPSVARGPGRDQELDLIYDGECPFCSNYVELVRLRERAGKVHLHNARDPEVRKRFPEIAAYDLDTGMMARWRGEWFHGAEAVHLISTLNRAAPLALLLASKRKARLLYPLLRAGRRCALLLRGIPKIGGADNHRT